MMRTRESGTRITGHIRAAEIHQASGAAWQADYDAARERREAPMSETEQAAVNQELIEAAVRAQDAMKPATRQQMAELIGLQRDLLEAIRKR